MSERIRVCRVDDLKPGQRQIIEVDGVSVGVLNVDGQYYALSNVCPHRGGPVCQGQINRRIHIEFGELGTRPTERVGESPTIACPWHGWEYDLTTGEHIGSSDIGIPTFDVLVEDDMIYIKRS